MVFRPVETARARLDDPRAACIDVTILLGVTGKLVAAEQRTQGKWDAAECDPVWQRGEQRAQLKHDSRSLHIDIEPTLGVRPLVARERGSDGCSPMRRVVREPGCSERGGARP